VVLKPNYNSADSFPASTHNDTARILIHLIQEAGAASVIVAERSGGSANSHEVADKKGVRPLFDALGVDYVILDDLSPEDWEHVPVAGGHWAQGIELPRLYLNAESIVMTCCLKTHGFGGHFTMSLKNAVGLVPRVSPSNGHAYMRELHSSVHQRSMIAEINQAFSPRLIVMDAVSAFSTGGPSRGTLVHPNLILASTDRIALDAVGVAILRNYETTPEVMNGAIFEQEQIRCAVELGLGVCSPQDIELTAAPDAKSQEWMQQIQVRLDE